MRSSLNVVSNTRIKQIPFLGNLSNRSNEITNVYMSASYLQSKSKTESFLKSRESIKKNSKSSEKF